MDTGRIPPPLPDRIRDPQCAVASGVRPLVHGHPQLGASWQGFAISNLIERLRARWGEEAFLWATYAGAEIDLVVMRGNRRLGFEVKRTSAPSVTPSLRIALQDLRPKWIDVLHAGRKTFPLADGIRAVATHRIWREVEPL